MMGYVSLGKQIVCQQLPPKKSHTTHDGSQAMNFSRPKKSPQDFRWDPQIPSLQARQLLVCKALSHPFEDSQTSCAVSSLEGQGALFVEFSDYSLPWLHQPRGFRAKKALIRTWAEQMSKTKYPDLTPRFKQEVSHRLEGYECTLLKHLKNQKLILHETVAIAPSVVENHSNPSSS